MRKLQNKKALIAGIALFAVVAVGSTFAFLRDSVPFENAFKLGAYEVDYVENFGSPNNWQPCDVTPKSVTVKNKGSVAIGARIKYSENWKSSSGADLPLTIETDDGQELTLAIPKFVNLDKWIYDGDEYYYYYKALEPGETSAPFMESVAFNCDVNLVRKEIQYTNTADGIVGQSTENEYLSSVYHLALNIQTIQRDAQSSAWGPLPSSNNP